VAAFAFRFESDTDDGKYNCYPFPMPPVDSRSPFQEGFAALRNEPLLLPAELMWRWCFALTAWILALGAAALFLDSINVSALDRFLLGSAQPALERSALNHIFHGALLRAIWIKFIVLAGLTFMWSFAAALGRAASLRSLLARCSSDDRAETVAWQFRPMFQLHLLRALWTWIAIGCLTASLLLGTVMQQRHHAAPAAFFYVFGVALSIVFGVILNWIFGLAPLFCIRNQTRAREAMSLTLDFCSRQGARLFGLSLGFLALRAVWAGSMFFLVLAPANLGKHVAFGRILAMMGVLFLVYLAGADALYLARLGAFCALAEIDAAPKPEPTPEPIPAPEPQPWTSYLPPPPQLATSECAGLQTEGSAGLQTGCRAGVHARTPNPPPSCEPCSLGIAHDVLNSSL
jgi:hypothetical protein